jgi:hypothetical protein
MAKAQVVHYERIENMERREKQLEGVSDHSFTHAGCGLRISVASEFTHYPINSAKLRNRGRRTEPEGRDPQFRGTHLVTYRKTWRIGALI